MKISNTYLPHNFFLASTDDGNPVPRAFVSPHRYVQGRGVHGSIGTYLHQLGLRHCGLMISTRGAAHEGRTIVAGLEERNVGHTLSAFNGECSLEEVAEHVEVFRSAGVDCVLAVGGGKCIDAGKCVAFRLGVPVISTPSLASNDAPCSALSVMYTPDGVSTGVEFFPESPAVVVVDTAVIAQAPERFLVAGMGDAMATWYEAQVCLRNTAGVISLGTRPTLAAAAIGQRCAEVLFQYGVTAAEEVRKQVTGDALEDIVEANTLLSGIGFESGGLAGAHAVAQAYTALPSVEHNFLHGEMVAMGTLTQLAMEGRGDEAEKVATFFARVGLPVHLGQIGLNRNESSSLKVLAEGTMAFPYIGNMPGKLDEAQVIRAVLEADTLGSDVAARIGDAAYRRLRKA